MGKPAVATDECTARKMRISYARVLIGVDITQNMKESISIREVDARLRTHEVKYEWISTFCDKRLAIGHNCKVNEKKKQTSKV